MNTKHDSRIRTGRLIFCLMLLSCIATLPVAAQSGTGTSTKPTDPNESQNPIPEVKAQSNDLSESPDEALAVKLPKENPLFESVRDKTELGGPNNERDANELLALDLVFRQCARFSPETLAKYSQPNVPFFDLIDDVARQPYLRELLHIEGRLMRLREIPLPSRFRDVPGVRKIYEGWLYHDNISENRVEVYFTELPPGMKVGDVTSYQVKLDAYYFKLLRYESKEKDANGRSKYRIAPLFICKTISLNNPEPFGWLDTLFPMVVGLVGAVVIAGFALTWWYRRSDRKTRQQMATALEKKNLFTNEEPPLGS